MSSVPVPSQEDNNGQKAEETDSKDPLLGAVLDFASDVQHRLSNEMLSALKDHEPKFRGLYDGLRETMHKELQEKLNQELETRLRQEIEQEMQLRDKVAAELNSREAEYESMNKETTEMIENPDIEIAKIVRRTARQRELKAYIRGLRYQQGDEEPKTETST